MVNSIYLKEKEVFVKGFDKTFYLVSCAIMGVITAAALLLTLYLGFSGTVPADSVWGNPMVLTLLIAMGALTVLCICLSAVGGKLLYKIGFYVLHCGLVVLIVGFVLTNLTSMKCYGDLTKLDQGGSLAPSVEFIEDGAVKQRVELTHSVGLKSLKTEDYESGQPKHYEAVLTLVDRTSRQEVKTLTVTVNNPVRIDGLKFYLMNVSKDGNTATFLVKDNPGEYVVIVGAVVLMIGTFVMCFSDGFSFKRLFSKRSGVEEKSEKSKGRRVKNDA